MDYAHYAINVMGGELPDAELAAYLERGKEKYGKQLIGLDVHLDGEYVELTYESSRDNALLLRDVVNGTYYAFRIFHSGMATPVPVANGGTGASSAKAALNSLGIFYAATLPSTGTDGQICLVPV